MKLQSPLGIYVHIPFCEKKCNYCDFLSFDNKKRGQIADYTKALKKQMKEYGAYAKGYLADTVYFGGGTPTILGHRELSALLATVRKNFHVSEYAEITCEANPKSGSFKTFKGLKKAGFTRLSIGVQSFLQKELDTLGRIHTAQEAKDAVSQAKKAGFANVSIDLMSSLPDQSEEDLLFNLQTAVDLGVNHISCYALKIEEGTPFYEMRDCFRLPDEEEDRKMYRAAVEFLDRNGYEHYEISNFAKSGYQSRHNLKYWNYEPYLGLGLGAHSYFNGKRFSFLRDFGRYIKGTNEGADIIDEYHDTPYNECVFEYIMLRLRLCEGIDPVIFEKRFGIPFDRAYQEKLEELIGGGFMKYESGRYCLTHSGIDVSNRVIAKLLDV